MIEKMTHLQKNALCVYVCVFVLVHRVDVWGLAGVFKEHYCSWNLPSE